MTSVADPQLTERLAGIVGDRHIVRSPSVEVDGVRPAVAAAPGTLEQAAAALAAAREAGAAVSPVGGGTQLRIGMPPARLDVALRTERLAALVEWEPADLTACVEAGMTLAKLQDALAARGQQLPLDAPCPDRATLGGLVATNTSGPRRWLHGGWRDLIVGMHMVLPDGAVIKSGGRVVKNVQGYDLGKLFTGSLGTLGLIGQINLKLMPLAPLRRLLVARGTRDAIARFLAEVAGSRSRVATLDLLDEAAAAVCGLAGTGYAGLVLVEDREVVTDAASVDVRRMATGTGARCDAVDGQALEPVWRAWVDLGRVDDLGPGEALLTVSAQPAEVASVLEALERAAGAYGVAARCWARAGNGVVFARLAASLTAAATVAGVQAVLLDRWPATTLVAGHPAVELAAKPWGADPPGLAAMRALKARFDPGGTLQPGRYVGGI